jgi:hypothetical protein
MTSETALSIMIGFILFLCVIAVITVRMAIRAKIEYHKKQRKREAAYRKRVKNSFAS